MQYFNNKSTRQEKARGNAVYSAFEGVAPRVAGDKVGEAHYDNDDD